MAKKQPFQAPKSVENLYARQLRRLAQQSSDIVNAHVDGSTVEDPQSMMESAELYSQAITPWATKISTDMLESINSSNEADWMAVSNRLNLGLEEFLNTNPAGQVAQQLLADQVSLIQSIPIDAAERAQQLSLEAAIGGQRADEVAELLANTTEVTKNRATLIARTEVASSNAAINQARSTSVGSSQYVWRTVGDARVRETHAELDGKIFDFNDPPEIEGEGAHGPGNFPNCRCFADPIIQTSATNVAQNESS